MATHLLGWTAGQREKLRRSTASLIEDLADDHVRVVHVQQRASELDSDVQAATVSLCQQEAFREADLCSTSEGLPAQSPVLQRCAPVPALRVQVQHDVQVRMLVQNSANQCPPSAWMPF